MKPFKHIKAPDIQTAVAMIKEPETAVIAGGTDLLTEMKKEIRHPERLVDIKGIPNMNRVRQENGELCIGALTTVADIEKNLLIKTHASLLAQAAAVVGSPQIRNRGTIGGNLCQQVRCWYYRHPEIHCWLKEGKRCFARAGLNRHHAIFGKSPCAAVNPSDLAPALIALDARVRVTSLQGTRELPVESHYKLPENRRRRQTVLNKDEVVVDIRIPVRSEAFTGLFIKMMDRETWSFALVSVATGIEWEENHVKQARIVLGGVAGSPWRVIEAEKHLTGRRMDGALAAEAGELAVSGAAPLDWNAYKIPMAKNLVKQALLDIRAVSD